MIIEDISRITDQVEEIDGERLYVLSRNMREGRDRLREMAEADKSNCVLSMLEKDLYFIGDKQNFAIAFRPIRRSSVEWIPCLIYKYENRWRRVQIENAHCLKCDWRGRIANPTNPDLYLTLENRFEIMNRIEKLAFCKCPKCGGPISRKAIWTEDSREHGVASEK